MNGKIQVVLEELYVRQKMVPVKGNVAEQMFKNIKNAKDGMEERSKNYLAQFQT